MKLDEVEFDGEFSSVKMGRFEINYLNPFLEKVGVLHDLVFYFVLGKGLFKPSIPGLEKARSILLSCV